MKPQEIHSEIDLEYRNLLEMLGRTLKYLEGLNIDPTLLKSYKQLLRFLRSRPADAIPEIIRGSVPSSLKTEKRVQPNISEQEIHSMPIEKILELALSEETSRKHLEQIASLRFGMTKGGLSVLRSRHALTEKICTLVRNENAHGSIVRAASQQGT